MSLFITDLCVCCTSCFCKEGYEGDGYSCSAINPCLRSNRGDCDTNVRFALYVCVCLYCLCVCLYSNNCCVDEGSQSSRSLVIVSAMSFAIGRVSVH